MALQDGCVAMDRRGCVSSVGRSLGVTMTPACGARNRTSTELASRSGSRRVGGRKD